MSLILRAAKCENSNNNEALKPICIYMYCIKNTFINEIYHRKRTARIFSEICR